MGTKVKTPRCYAAPLKTRKAIIDWLNNDRARCWHVRGGPDYDRNCWLFCFNVKLPPMHHKVNHQALLELALEEQVIGREEVEDEPWVKATGLRYDETNIESLFDHACETARTRFVGVKGLPEDDGFRMLPSGQLVKPQFAFMGRSGGWLVLTHFMGHKLDAESQGTARTWEHWDFRDLVKLYKFLVMLSYDLRTEAVQEMVMSELAGSFFCNVCHDLALTKDLRGGGI